MNDHEQRCDICGGAAAARGWLRCMLCGRAFHFSTADDVSGRDCGVIAPNPASENGC